MEFPVSIGELTLKNPVMVAAGPWTRDPASVERFVKAGAGAVITESITMDANSVVQPYMYGSGNRLFNTKLYSSLHLEDWEEGFSRVSMDNCRLICSIWGSTISEVTYLTEYVQRMGADAVELSLYAPVGTRNRSLYSNPEQISELIRGAVQVSDVPVMIKLPYELSFFPEVLQAIYDAGVHTVSAIDALRGISGVDTERVKTRMPTFGGYTGEVLRPVSLATIATLKQYTPFNICACGGISEPEHAIEAIMLGAGAVQVASAIFEKGEGVVTGIVNGIEEWLTGHGYESIEQIRGAALGNLRPLEDLPDRSMKAVLGSACADTACDNCRRGCIYHAVGKTDEGYMIDPEACSGCGFCAQACPRGLITLEQLPPVAFSGRR